MENIYRLHLIHYFASKEFNNKAFANYSSCHSSMVKHFEVFTDGLLAFKYYGPSGQLFILASFNTNFLVYILTAVQTPGFGQVPLSFSWPICKLIFVIDQSTCTTPPCTVRPHYFTQSSIFSPDFPVRTNSRLHWSQKSMAIACSSDLLQPNLT